MLRGAADEVLAVLKNENLKVRSSRSFAPLAACRMHGGDTCLLRLSMRHHTGEGTATSKRATARGGGNASMRGHDEFTFAESAPHTLPVLCPVSYAPQDPERERELGALLGDGVGEVFPVLVSYGKLITDYSADGAAAGVAHTRLSELTEHQLMPLLHPHDSISAVPSEIPSPGLRRVSIATAYKQACSRQECFVSVSVWSHYKASGIDNALPSADGAAELDDADKLDADIGVAVEFEGEDEDEESDGDEVLVSGSLSGAHGSAGTAAEKSVCQSIAVIRLASRFVQFLLYAGQRSAGNADILCAGEARVGQGEDWLWQRKSDMFAEVMCCCCTLGCA